MQSEKVQNGHSSGNVRVLLSTSRMPESVRTVSPTRKGSESFGGRNEHFKKGSLLFLIKKWENNFNAFVHCVTV